MKKVFIIVIGYSAMWLSACAAISTPEQTVATRADEYMKLVIAGEILATYDYLSPGYKSSVSPDSYVAGFMARKVRWKAASVLATNCNGSRCTVTIKVDSAVFAPVPGVSSFDLSDTLELVWVHTQGNWWYLPKK